MKTSDFDYYLPQELIAQTPLEQRDHSRLMVLNRKDGSIEHRHFSDIPDYLLAEDLLVMNNTRVIPARLSGNKADSGGKLEILLLRRLEMGIWEALVKRSNRLRTGAMINISKKGDVDSTSVQARVLESKENGIKILSFSDEKLLLALGAIALPPYVHTPLRDTERYQTVYSLTEGSVAAPTAGLHFTPKLLGNLKSAGIRICYVTLHVGLDTFQPVREDDPNNHVIHKEYGELNQDTATEISSAKREGRRVICVGTTSVRIVEAAATASGLKDLQPFQGWVDLFILTGYCFKYTNAMITNFHLPKTTLLMLVTAFAGSELITKAYNTAIAEEYRFYSFGDAMLII
ncbi:tRNA preQ1(34) S-adenosylmethionine ribosyltransferase-isomerase QueA [Chloroflexota bacterium]